MSKNDLREEGISKNTDIVTYLPNGIESEMNQIKKYGGFYIGRYESGLPEEIVRDEQGYSDVSNDKVYEPKIKKNSIVWNNISANNAMKSSELLHNTETLKSGLITHTQWSAIIQWLENAGYNVRKDSKKWGNYSNSNFIFTGQYSIDNGKTYKYATNKNKQTYNMILSTGATERNKANNIYDFAGNIWEWTSTYRDGGYIYTGGYYDSIGAYSAEYGLIYSKASYQIGFRVVLYIK